MKPKNMDDLNPRIIPLPTHTRERLLKNESAPHILADGGWHTWGSSVVAGPDGKYHLFYARWPRANGFSAWLTHSEIAHGVADTPEGPYTYADTALASAGGERWDAITAHNPKIKYFDGRYYLYYIGTHADPPGISAEALLDTAREGNKGEHWWPLRRNQRTGVAVSASLQGPWERLDRPIVEPAGPITTLTVNPAVCLGPEGTYFMIVKGDKPGEKRFIRNQALAVAERPEGPFRIQPEPVIDYLDTEDVSMWYDRRRERFYAVFHAHTYIGMITSADGYRWEPASRQELLPREISFDDGEKWIPDRMERPFVLTGAEGQAAVLYVACKGGEVTANIAMFMENGSRD